jgi:hypothetical protein
MPGVPRELAEHSLNVSKTDKPVKQKLRRFVKDHKEFIRVEILKRQKSIVSWQKRSPE